MTTLLQNPSKGAPIRWIDNMKLLAMLGVLSFHFFLFFSKRATDPLALIVSVKDVALIPFQLGWQGNELFLAASGFGLAFSRMHRQQDWIAFITARAWRIYLPYWVTIAVIFVYQLSMHYVGSWDVPYVTPTDPRQWIANIFLLNLNGTIYLSSHHWFLFTLIPLYLLFPMFFSLCRRLGLYSFIVILLVQIIVVKGGMNFGPFGTVMSLTSWMGSFCTGILLGIATYRDAARTERLLKRALPLGIVLWVSGTIGVFYRETSYLIDIILCSGAVICIYQLARLPWSFPFLNKLTFEIYLVHMPFVGFYRHFFGFVEKPLWAIYLFYLISSVLMGWLVHTLIVLVQRCISLFPSRRKLLTT